MTVINDGNVNWNCNAKAITSERILRELGGY